MNVLKMALGKVKILFLNKHYNSVFILLIASKSIIKFSLKMVFFYLLNKKKYYLNKSRLDGLLSLYLKKNCNIKLNIK